MGRANSIGDLFDLTVVQPNECWLYTGPVNTSGYGQFRLNGHVHLVHRLSYETCKGEIPSGLLVCHTCDTKLCINPEHLFVGTEKNNTDDMMAKGRNFVATGSKHGQAKLTEQSVASIKLYLKEGVLTQREIGFEFGVERKTISDIATGKTWRHVS